jgi:hypothetical protein
MLAQALGNLVRRRLYLTGAAGPPWVIACLCLVPAGAYYAGLLSLSGPTFFAPVPMGLTFNSMLLHLLHGTFDVDPQTIGAEGSLRNGLTYTYFGIVMALIRLPFVGLSDFATIDFTRLSCLAAASVMAFFKVASVLTVWRAAGRSDRSILLVLFTIAILFGGPQVQFLRSVIYQEVALWAAALASAFVYLVIRGYYSERGFTSGLLAALATVAGLCLLTRVSTALGLYLALGFLWLQLAWRALRAAAPGPSRLAVLTPFVASAVILGAFVAIAGFVNYERWGNPLLFTDSQLHLYAMQYAPDRLVRSERYGQFNLIRLGYGLAYYFFPVWAMRAGDGGLLWSAFEQRTLDSVELPPSSFLISDPLIIGLAVFALVQLVGRREVLNRAVAVPVLAGLFVPIALMLTFISMTFRYRLEFYPFFELCAFLGFGVLLSRPAEPPLRWFAAAAIAGIVASHALWFFYMLSPFGNASLRLGGMDVISFYRSYFP